MARRLDRMQGRISYQLTLCYGECRLAGVLDEASSQRICGTEQRYARRPKSGVERQAAGSRPVAVGLCWMALVLVIGGIISDVG